MNPVDPHGLLRAVIDEPENDIHRLAYADWLAETGHVERAELIRLQLYLHSRPECPDWCDCDPKNCKPTRLEADTRKIIRNNIGEWSDNLPDSMVTRSCPVCIEQAADWETNVIECRQCDSTGLVPCYESIEFTRGFVSTVRLTMKEFLTKDVAGYLFSHHPIERVVFTDKVPQVFSDVPAVWNRYMNDVLADWDHTESESHIIPGVLFDSMDGEPGSHFFVVDKYGDKRYDSIYSAQFALSVVAVRHGKGITR
jgi:uncharacterized protein (TIGR02996 family)